MSANTSPSAATDSIRYRERVQDELIAIVCSRLRASLVVEAVVVPAVIIALVWGVASALELTLWLVTHLPIVVLHVFIYLRYRTQGVVGSNALTKLLRLSMLLAGVYWAVMLSYMLIVTPTFLYHLYIYLFAGALSVLAVTVISEDMESLIGFIAPLNVTLAVMCFLEKDFRYWSLGAMGLLCTAALALFAREKHRGMHEALRLRFSIADMAEELRAQRDAAERANVSKSKFLAAASHDLRQPLHALTLLTTALQNKTLDSDTSAIATDMTNAIGSLEKMFGSLLDISRLDAGVLHPEYRHFHLDDLLRRLIDEFTPVAQLKKLRLSCKYSAAVVRTDPLLLERIVRNYIANALRYTPTGEVQVVCRNALNSVRIEVIDTGIGIADDQQDEIFSEFYQVNNPERDRSKGLGLGLAIVRRIADLLQLTIGLESAPNKGARFFVDVPLGDSALVEVTNSAGLEPAPTLQGLRVLVIDDDRAVRESMRTLLQTWNCRVVIGDDSVEAIEVARQEFKAVDALIVDYRLREQQTGIEAIELVRATFGSSVPALIVSGDTAPERLREVATSGHTLVHKPAAPASLRAFLVNAQRIKNSMLEASQLSAPQ